MCDGEPDSSPRLSCPCPCPCWCQDFGLSKDGISLRIWRVGLVAVRPDLGRACSANTIHHPCVSGLEADVAAGRGARPGSSESLKIVDADARTHTHTLTHIHTPAQTAQENSCRTAPSWAGPMLSKCLLWILELTLQAPLAQITSKRWYHSGKT